MFTTERGDFGERVVLTGPWTDEAGAYIEEHRVADLCVNYARGWVGGDLKFLLRLPWLRALTLLFGGQSSAITAPVNTLTNLEFLNLNCPLDKAPIDLAVFGKLCYLGVAWRKGISNLELCTSLQTVSCGEYPCADLSAFGALPRLKSLILKSPRILSLTGAQTAASLEELVVVLARRLRSLNGIGTYQQLYQLEIDGPGKPLGDIEALASLTKLRKLVLANCGDIESIEFVVKMSHLEKFLFYERTSVVSGDMTPLLRAPSLLLAAFQNRRHYSHKDEEIDALIAKKRAGALS